MTSLRTVIYSVITTAALASIGQEASASAATKADEPPVCTDQPQSAPAFELLTGNFKATGINPPKLIHSVDANLSEEARKAGRKVINKHFPRSIIRFTVDKQGMPTDLCLQQAVGYGLDDEAGKAVRQYRFKPATKDGTPIAVQIHVQVSFRIF